jgi:prevent-host-death family protein
VYSSSMADLSMTEARKRFGLLVRQAATSRQRTTITDHGQPAAVLVNAQELADLEEALALAEYRVQQASGTLVSVPQADARERLGLPRR